MKTSLARTFLAIVCLAATHFLRAAELPLIQPGEIWPDDRGQHIQAHGGGILKFGDTYYWFGEDRSQSNARTNRCVACYSSTNLAQWTFRSGPRFFTMTKRRNS